MHIRIQFHSIIYFRIILWCVFFCLYANEVKTQNLVPNYSFEDYSSIPSGYGEWWKCDLWDNVNEYIGFLWPYASPDFLHNSGLFGVDLPVSTFATLDPHEGDAVMGFVAYSYEPDFREYLSVSLIDPLVPGTEYTVSFWITNGESGWYNNGGSDNLAIQFSEGALMQVDHEPIGGTPQVEIPGIYWTDEWELFTFSYTAVAPYDRITIGNFETDATTNFSVFAPFGSEGAYYFIDEIIVMAAEITTTIIDTSICIGSIYTLPDGSTTIAAGTYNTVLTGAGGDDSIIITNLYVAPVYSLLTTDVMCAGGTYLLPDGTIATGAGTYISELLTSYGCDSIINTVLTEVPFLTYDVEAFLCEGESYLLPDGTIVTIGGIYITTLTTAAGCDSIINTTLSVLPSSTDTVNAEICTGTSYTLPDGSIVTTGGSYLNTFVSIGGCDSIIVTNLTITTGITINVDASICEGEEYILPDGIIVNTSGSYTSNFIATGGCDSAIITNLEVHLIPVAFFELPEFICTESGNLLLVGTPSGGLFSGTGVSVDIFDPILAGEGGPYEITYLYTDTNGCSSEFIDSTWVGDNFADAGMDLTINYGESTMINGTSDGDFNWDPPAGLNCWDCSSPMASPTQTTTYLLTSIDENGCTATDNVIVTVIGEPDIIIPNAFSPNKDGSNDIFHIVENGAIINNFSVYDRWGRIMYFTSSSSVAWDGTFSGKDLEIGVYTYIIEFTSNDVLSKRSGNITLLR